MHHLLQQDKHCTGCAKDLRLIGEEASERYEYIPAFLLVIGDVCLKYACDCTVRTAGKPAQPIEKGTAGASLLAQIIVGKFASYLLIDGATLSIRRVEYDIERKIKALGQSLLPRSDWIAKTLLAAAPRMP